MSKLLKICFVVVHCFVDVDIEKKKVVSWCSLTIVDDVDIIELKTKVASCCCSLTMVHVHIVFCSLTNVDDDDDVDLPQK